MKLFLEQGKGSLFVDYLGALCNWLLKSLLQGLRILVLRVDYYFVQKLIAVESSRNASSQNGFAFKQIFKGPFKVLVWAEQLELVFLLLEHKEFLFGLLQVQI